jgi:MoxR-like ATPase
VIGKPGAGKTSLVRRLAAEWKCELINRKWRVLCLDFMAYSVIVHLIKIMIIGFIF